MTFVCNLPIGIAFFGILPTIGEAQGGVAPLTPPFCTGPDPTLTFDPQPTLTPHDALAGILHYFKQHTIAILCVKGLIPHPLNIGLMQSVLIRNLTPHLTKISALCIRVDVRYMCKMMNEIFQIPTDLLTVFLPKYKRRQP